MMKNTITSFLNLVDSILFHIFQSNDLHLKLDLLLFASSNSANEDNSDEGGPSNPQAGESSNPQADGPSNTEGDNIGGQNPPQAPLEDAMSEAGDDAGYRSDSVEPHARYDNEHDSEIILPSRDIPKGNIPEANLRRFIQSTAADCRNLTPDSPNWRKNYELLRGELEEKHERPVGPEEFLKEDLEKYREEHQDLVNELARRKEEGLVANSPPREYDIENRWETSAAESSNNTANQQPSASANSANPSGDDVNPSSRPSFLETVLNDSSPSPARNEDSTVDEASNSNNQEETTKTNEKAKSSNEIKLEDLAINSPTSKRKLEEEEGESSTQPSKKFKQNSTDVNSDSEPFDFCGGDD